MERKSWDVQVELHVVLQVYTCVCACGDGPEGRAQLEIVDLTFPVSSLIYCKAGCLAYPNLDIRSVKEQVQPTGMVDMQVTDDNFLDVFDFVARRLNRGIELVLRVVLDSAEDIGDLWSPYLQCPHSSAHALIQERIMVGCLRFRTSG